MAEGSASAFVRKVVAKLEPYLPQVPKPKKKLTLQRRLMWCGGILLIYMIMGQTPLFGATTPEFDFLAFARVIFASQQGTLVELGIGPIVTAGLLMQLLRGSEILKFDFKKPEERGIFQTATKLVTYIVIHSLRNCSLWAWNFRSYFFVHPNCTIDGGINNYHVLR